MQLSVSLSRSLTYLSLSLHDLFLHESCINLSSSSYMFTALWQLGLNKESCTGPLVIRGASAVLLLLLPFSNLPAWWHSWTTKNPKRPDTPAGGAHLSHLRCPNGAGIPPCFLESLNTPKERAAFSSCWCVSECWDSTAEFPVSLAAQLSSTFSISLKPTLPLKHGCSRMHSWSSSFEFNT